MKRKRRKNSNNTCSHNSGVIKICSSPFFNIGCVAGCTAELAAASAILLGDNEEEEEEAEAPPPEGDKAALLFLSSFSCDWICFKCS